MRPIHYTSQIHEIFQKLNYIEIIITNKYPNGFQTLSSTQQDILNQTLAITRTLRNNINDNPLIDQTPENSSQLAIIGQALAICS